MKKNLKKVVKTRNDILFEPGATFYTQGFKIKNTGDVPVNFSLSVSKDDKINMEEFDKAFELWIVKEGDDLSGAEKITNFKVNGLAKGESSATATPLHKPAVSVAMASTALTQDPVTNWERPEVAH